MSLVSVIMNCHNGEKFLNESLKSVIDQTYQNWELIFFDNLSNDNSKKILQNYKDKRIKYYSSKKFLDLYAARNEAIDKSNGKYISFLDTDDYWAPNKLEEQIKFLESNREYKIVYSNYYIFDQKKKTESVKHKSTLPFGFISQKLLDFYCVGILSVLLEKSFFNSYSFNNEYNIIGDFDLIIRLSHKFKIGCIQKPLAYYRIHNNNFSLKKIDIYINELNKWIKFYEKEFSSYRFNLRKQKFLLFKLRIKNFLKRLF